MVFLFLCSSALANVAVWLVALSSALPLSDLVVELSVAAHCASKTVFCRAFSTTELVFFKLVFSEKVGMVAHVSCFDEISGQ